MSFLSLQTHQVHVYKNEHIVLERTTIAGAITLTRQPYSPAVLNIHVFDVSPIAGTVSVVGLVNGVTTSEDVVFAGTEYQATANLFTSVTGLCVSGLGGGNITVEATTNSGQPISQWVAVALSMGVSIRKPSYKAKVGFPGNISMNDYALFSNPNVLLKKGYVVFDITAAATYSVLEDSKPIFAHNHLHHYETRISGS